MIGMIAEPVIYLVVWSTVAEPQGGSVGGYTPGRVRRLLHRLDTGAQHEYRLHALRLGVAHPARAALGELLRPIHPIHGDVAYFAGWKVVVIVLWLPMAAILAMIFKPTLIRRARRWLSSRGASGAAYLIRTMLLSLWG